MRIFTYAVFLLILICAQKNEVLAATCSIFHVETSVSSDSSGDDKKATSKTGSKICACQILNLQSTNYHHKNLVVFAEKTNNKRWVTDVNRAIRIVEKEKRHLKYFFYKDLVVVNNFTEASDCKSLYARLKMRNRSLVLYDILDADVRR